MSSGTSPAGESITNTVEGERASVLIGGIDYHRPASSAPLHSLRSWDTTGEDVLNPVGEVKPESCSQEESGCLA